MKAFRVDDYTVWAAETAEQAADSYLYETGEPCLDDYPHEVTDAELDVERDELDENEAPTGNKTTMRAWLAEMTEPGFLAGAL